MERGTAPALRAGARKGSWVQIPAPASLFLVLRPTMTFGVAYTPISFSLSNRFMLGFIGKVVVNSEHIKDIGQNKEKLREWLDSIPEAARQREPANVLAFVFFVEVLKEKEKKKEGVNSNA